MPKKLLKEGRAKRPILPIKVNIEIKETAKYQPNKPDKTALWIGFASFATAVVGFIDNHFEQIKTASKAIYDLLKAYLT